MPSALRSRIGLARRNYSQRIGSAIEFAECPAVETGVRATLEQELRGRSRALPG